MKEYIERNKAIQNFMQYTWYDDFGVTIDDSDEKRKMLEDMFSAIPAADVVEVRHGKWKPFDRTWGRNVLACTVCNNAMEVPTSMGDPLYTYCPNCGAKMDADPGAAGRRGGGQRCVIMRTW